MAQGGGGLSFNYGPMQWTSVGASGCGGNADGEPAIHVSRTGALFLGSEAGLGSGSDGWVLDNGTGGPGASACSPTYIGQPNPVPVANGGGDIDLAWGTASSGSNYPLYVASLNGGSITVSVSNDGGHHFAAAAPAQGGLPGGDREWIAADGPKTSVISFHDPSGNIEVIRSTNGGPPYVHVGFAYQGSNAIGNIAYDHRNGTLYQSLVEEGSQSVAAVAVSTTGGSLWSVHSIGCSVSGLDLAHQFPNISVAPDGTLWETWSDDTNVHVGVSHDGGTGWSCGSVSSNTGRAIFPWIVAGSGGSDLVYYGTTDNTNWYVYFVQNVGGSWGTPVRLMSVHSGAVCEQGVACNPSPNTRQLYDDFGIDIDPNGWAHIAYSHDSPDLGGGGTYTGYAVQTGGAVIGHTN